MIILDLHQVLYANIAAQIDHSFNTEIEEDLLRHMVLNTIRNNYQKFKSTYGELVIACDDGNYWRKNIFPYYKARRKLDQQASNVNWKQIHESFHKIREELKENFPYKVLHVANAEADDVVSTLCMAYGEVLKNENNKLLIISGDKDFIQLQVYGNVQQWDPIRKNWITHPNPSLYLKEHIMRGDTGDGVPNFLSDDDTFIVSNKRQKPLLQKKVDVWVNQPPNMFCDPKQLRNYERNKALIDLSTIPENIKSQVMNQYISQKDKKVPSLMNYFMKHRLKNLMENIGDF
jgi:hypothetical protein